MFQFFFNACSEVNMMCWLFPSSSSLLFLKYNLQQRKFNQKRKRRISCSDEYKLFPKDYGSQNISKETLGKRLRMKFEPIWWTHCATTTVFSNSYICQSLTDVLVDIRILTRSYQIFMFARFVAWNGRWHLIPGISLYVVYLQWQPQGKGNYPQNAIMSYRLPLHFFGNWNKQNV